MLSKRRRRATDSGFTLIELVVTVSIVGIIAAGLTGVVISYLKHTVNTQARMTESQDIQFAAAYWQRDVASIGVRPTIDPDADPPDPDPDATSFDFEPSVQKRVGSTPPANPCGAGGGVPVVTLAWTEFASADWTTSTRVTIVYSETTIDGRRVLTRTRCNGSSRSSSVVVADHLVGVPTITCRNVNGAETPCNGAADAVPATVSMSFEVQDQSRRDLKTFPVTLTGERRQS